jgi:hypothetical protein
MEIKRVSSAMKFAFHVPNLCYFYVFITNLAWQLFVTEGCDKVSTGVLENQFIYL